MLEPTPLSAYLTVREAATLLHVTRRTVSRWIRDRAIPSVKISGRRLVWRNGLDHVATAHRATGSEVRP